MNACSIMLSFNYVSKELNRKYLRKYLLGKILHFNGKLTASGSPLRNPNPKLATNSEMFSASSLLLSSEETKTGKE